MDDVEDRDLGWKATTARLVAADGMEARVGVLSGRSRYPSHGRTQVAKVAGVHHVDRTMGAKWDEMQGQIIAAAKAVRERLAAGVSPEVAILEVVEPYRDAVRAVVHDTLHHTGLLEADIGAAVFDRGKWLAGDPKNGVKL